MIERGEREEREIRTTIVKVFKGIRRRFLIERHSSLLQPSFVLFFFPSVSLSVSAYVSM